MTLCWAALFGVVLVGLVVLGISWLLLIAWWIAEQVRGE